MKPVQQWSPKRLADAFTSCQEARKKYLAIGRKIGSDAEHAHAKLGQFLDEVLGEGWTEWLTGDELTAAALCLKEDPSGAFCTRPADHEGLCE